MDSRLLEQATSFACDFLWIDKEVIEVKIVPLKEHLFGNACETVEGEYEVEVTEYASTENQLVTLFHELVHVRQFMLGDLFYDNNNKLAWKGADYGPEQPWEVEARMYETIMYNEFFLTTNTVERI